MPTVGDDLNTTAVDLVVRHGLTAGSGYSIINTGRGVILLAENPTDPTTDTTPPNPLADRHWELLMPSNPERLPGSGVITPLAGQGIWAKSLNGRASYSLTETP